MSNGQAIRLELAAEADQVAGAIERRLLAELRAGAPDSAYGRLVLVVRDAQDALAGGLAGFVSYGWLHVSALWIDAPLRRRGLGRRLMGAAENEARRRGCHSAWLDTSSAGAYAFYLRLGYAELALLENGPGRPPEGHRRWLLRKPLV